MHVKPDQHELSMKFLTVYIGVYLSLAAPLSSVSTMTMSLGAARAPGTRRGARGI
jgi:hypothetical protein